jgi:hypothetical protein
MHVMKWMLVLVVLITAVAMYRANTIEALDNMEVTG